MHRLGSRCVRLSLLVSGDDNEDAYAVAVTSTGDPSSDVHHHHHHQPISNHDEDDDDVDDDATQSLLQYSHWDDVRPGSKSYEQHCRSSVMISRSASGLHEKFNHRRSVSFPAAVVTAKIATPDEAADLDSAHDFL